MLWSYISSVNQSPDGTGLVGLEICLQVLLGWSLICPTIPCMRPLAMRFTTGGAIVLAGESVNTGTGPSMTKSYPGSRRCRPSRSHIPNSQQQEQDELELNPRVSDKPASTIRTSGGDEQGSIKSHVVSQGGIHFSREYEVYTQEMKYDSGKTAFPASSLVVASK